MSTPTPTPTTTPTLTIHGSCHCRKITYSAIIPTPTPSNPLTVYRCNCTVCQKPNFTSLRLTPDTFTLLTPTSRAEIGDYVYRTADVHRYFCRACGVQVYGEGKYPDRSVEGGWVEFLSVNLNTVDQPQEGVELSDVRVLYANGLGDRQGDGLRERPFPGGLI